MDNLNFNSKQTRIACCLQSIVFLLVAFRLLFLTLAIVVWLKNILVIWTSASPRLLSAPHQPNKKVCLVHMGCAPRDPLILSFLIYKMRISPILEIGCCCCCCC